MAKVVTDIQPLVKNIIFTPNLSNIPIANLEINKLPMENILLMTVKNNLALKRNKILKYIFDMVLTVVGTICKIVMSVIDPLRKSMPQLLGYFCIFRLPEISQIYANSMSSEPFSGNGSMGIFS